MALYFIKYTNFVHPYLFKILPIRTMYIRCCVLLITPLRKSSKFESTNIIPVTVLLTLFKFSQPCPFIGPFNVENGHKSGGAMSKLYGAVSVRPIWARPRVKISNVPSRLHFTVNDIVKEIYIYFRLLSLGSMCAYVYNFYAICNIFL